MLFRSTLGNAIDFGDLTVGRSEFGSCASPTRGVWGGGKSPSFKDEMDYVQIMTTGNSIDFGDILAGNQYLTGLSNGHGGLG